MIDSSSSFVPKENWKCNKQSHLEKSLFEKNSRHDSEMLENTNNSKNVTGIKSIKSNDERRNYINLQTKSSITIDKNPGTKPQHSDVSLIYHKIKHRNETVKKFLTRNNKSPDVSLDLIEEQNEENDKVDEFEVSLHNVDKVLETHTQSLPENTINQNPNPLIFVESPSTGRFYTRNEHDVDQLSLSDGYNKEYNEISNGKQNTTPRGKLISKIKRLTYFGNLFLQGILAGYSIPPLLEVLSNHRDCFDENCGQFDTSTSLMSRSILTNRFFYVVLNVCLLGALSLSTSQNIECINKSVSIMQDKVNIEQNWDSTNGNKRIDVYNGIKRLILILLFASSLVLTMVLQLYDNLEEHKVENFVLNGKGNILMGMIRSILCILAWMITCQSFFSM